MKNLVSRIVKLEAVAAHKSLKIRTLNWSDDDEEELSTIIARDMEETGFDGEYFLVVGVTGCWKEQANGESIWTRPPRAAERYAKWGSYEPHSETILNEVTI